MLLRPMLALFLLAAGGAAQADSAPTSAPASRRAAAIAASADRILAEVAELRGVPAVAEYRVGVYAEAELRTFIETEFATELPEPRLEFLARAWKLAGLLPAEFDLRRGYLELLTAQIAGFYDPRRKELRLVARDPAETDSALAALARGLDLDEITMAHELVHALQDARYGLLRLPLDAPLDDDLSLAARALVEGDAVAAMMAYVFRKSGAPPDRVFNPTVARAAVGAMNIESLPGGKGLRTAPAWLREALIFPYVQGLSFCLALASPARSFAPLDDAFRRPPASTEQILHPAKYAGPDRDDPQEVSLPPLSEPLGSEYVVAGTNVFGELGFRIWLDAPPAGASRAEVRAVRNAAHAAAAGWDGDRYVLYVAPNRPDVLVLASVWDSPDEAAEAGAALAGRFPPADGETPAGIVVRVAGDRVFAVRGAPLAAASNVLELLERATKFAAKPESRPAKESK